MPVASDPVPPNASPAAARACALRVLLRVDREHAWADRALHGEARRDGLDARDRALATRLVFETVQRQRTLDHVIEQLSGRDPGSLEPAVRAALRLGLAQLLLLDRLPPHAVVSDAVELVKRDAPRAAGLVNAVLRRAGKEGPSLLAALDDRTPHSAAVMHSHPDWLAERWWSELGAEDARALMAADNTAAEHALRANTLRTDAAALAAELGVASRPAGPDLPEGLVLDGPHDLHGDEAFSAGRLMPQSRAAMSVSRLLAPEPGDRVLDLCAAPGGKTTHLAALMGGSGQIVAVERHEGRAEALRRTVERMGADAITVLTADAREPLDGPAFDRVLVDPPCSDLGTLRSRPDARWHKRPDDAVRLAHLQGELLRAGIAALRPGGTLVYSTCTISRAENEDVVASLLADRPDVTLDDLGFERPAWRSTAEPRTLQSLPHRDGTDGFFIARLRLAEG